ncbi:hypothetical protein [Falsiroseomonas stagni]|uniref:Uncharacterized protein n=1 Tax=Falsiroseomonas stagni DSM 19981 TaxID=1123062 RepID=A0A1I4E3D1_9PROT|nr:hypothetical protein [Falsiroseomonas stagni]SFK98866.1 hypothetical protein SAMN02745775_11373 [Falsiroseomonas stagni DSM 19981]
MSGMGAPCRSGQAVAAIVTAVALALPLAACRSTPPLEAPAPAPGLTIESPTPWTIGPPGRGIPR